VVPLDDHRTEIWFIAAKIFSGVVGETEMIADPKGKPHQDDGDSDKRSRQEEALDESLEGCVYQKPRPCCRGEGIA
jgi:hypothetical protein